MKILSVRLPGLIGCLLFLMSTSIASAMDSSSTGVLLEKKHKDLGIECTQCHKDNPETAAETDSCLECHQSIAEAEPSETEHVEGTLPNPHNAHMPFPECSSCHHVHKESENQCVNCHDFEFKTP